MNCDISNEVIQRICAAGWRDSFFEATGIQMPGFTFHNFSGEKWQGDMGGCGNDKMDWIFLRGKLRATGASIIKDHEKSLYPSDHYFVTADLKLC
jgi:endonuclease/exonuclease/phosphatase family metal-dependent hydrolase